MTPEMYAFLTRIPFIGVIVCGLSFMFLMVGFITYLVIDVIRNPGKPEPNAWASLAKVNNLRYRPGTFSPIGSGALIVGDYRNHHLKLEIFYTIAAGTYSLFRSQVNTRLILYSKGVIAKHKESDNEDIFHRQKTANDVMSLLAPNGLPYEWEGTIKVKPSERAIYYEQYGIENDEAYLQTLFDLLSDIADAYPKILALGGEVVPALEAIAKDKNQLQFIATQLLQDIGQKTTKQLAKSSSRLLCPRCYVRFSVHKTRLQLWRTVTYYGCRRCKQSNEFIDKEGQVIAVLDSKSPMRLSEQNGKLYVNWFAHPEPFDFDGVEITWATDEDVERFAVKLGNDADPLRQPCYRQMPCLISPNRRLSENSIKILRKTFGQVVIKAEEPVKL